MAIALPAVDVVYPKMRAPIIALLFVVVQVSLVAGVDELLFVQAVWRHGDRSPTHTYPNDQYQEDHWPQGWGELSTVGMAQHFALGARIRDRYKNFISATYKPGEIYVRSTDLNRTLLSAMSNLAGFYQTGLPGVTFPDANSVSSWPSHWSPVPVHTVDDNTDHIGNSGPYCPRLNQLMRQMQQRDSFKNITQQNQPLFNYLTQATGMHISLASGISSLQDILYIEQVNNLTKPTWLNDSIWNQIVNLTQIADDFEFGIYPPVETEVIRLRGGSLLKSIINQMQLKLHCLVTPTDTACHSQLSRKYYVYSAHDTTIAALLTTLRDEHEVLHMLLPKYSSSVLIELWNLNDVPNIKILYHPDFNADFYPITSLTQGCPQDSDFCPLTTFVQRSQPYIPNNIDVECQAK